MARICNRLPRGLKCAKKISRNFFSAKMRSGNTGVQKGKTHSERTVQSQKNLQKFFFDQGVIQEIRERYRMPRQKSDLRNDRAKIKGDMRKNWRENFEIQENLENKF